MADSDINWLQILKWVLVVLAAGFIGQFGKRLADFLLTRRRKRMEAGGRTATTLPKADVSSLGRAATHNASNSDTPNALDAKTAKKLAKAAAKAAKKAAKTS